MNHAAANELLAEAAEAVAKRGLSVGQDVCLQIGSALEGSGAAALLWLGAGYTGRAADVLAALRDCGLRPVPHTMNPGALGAVGWLRNGGKVEVRRMYAD